MYLKDKEKDNEDTGEVQNLKKYVQALEQKVDTLQAHTTQHHTATRLHPIVSEERNHKNAFRDRQQQDLERVGDQIGYGQVDTRHRYADPLQHEAHLLEKDQLHGERDQRKGYSHKQENEMAGRHRLQQEEIGQQRRDQNRIQQQKYDRQRDENERFERQRLDREELDRQRLDRDELERQRLDRDRFDGQRLNSYKFERQTLDRDKLEKHHEQDLLDKKRHQQDRLENEQREQDRRDRIKKERLEKERQDYEIDEKIRKNKDEREWIEMHNDVMKTLGVDLKLIKSSDPNLFEELKPVLDEGNYTLAGLMVKGKDKPFKAPFKVDNALGNLLVDSNDQIPQQLKDLFKANGTKLEVSLNEVKNLSPTQINNLALKKVLSKIDPVDLPISTLSTLLNEDPSLASHLPSQMDSEDLLAQLASLKATLSHKTLTTTTLPSALKSQIARNPLQRPGQSTILPQNYLTARELFALVKAKVIKVAAHVRQALEQLLGQKFPQDSVDGSESPASVDANSLPLSAFSPQIVVNKENDLFMKDILGKSVM